MKKLYTTRYTKTKSYEF